MSKDHSEQVETADVACQSYTSTEQYDQENMRKFDSAVFSYDSQV